MSLHRDAAERYRAKGSALLSASGALQEEFPLISQKLIKEAKWHFLRAKEELAEWRYEGYA